MSAPSAELNATHAPGRLAGMAPVIMARAQFEGLAQPLWEANLQLKSDPASKAFQVTWLPMRARGRP